MGRENIRFRAWDENQEYMAYQGNPDLETIQSFFFHFGDALLTQSTGLFDQNGKEIFEDDIVETSYSRDHEQRHAFLVEWYEDGGQWVFTPFEVGNQDAPLLGIEEFSHSWEDINLVNAEVIGNIYENPELQTK